MIKTIFQEESKDGHDLFQVIGALSTVLQHSHISIIGNNIKKAHANSLPQIAPKIADSVLPYKGKKKSESFKWRQGITKERFEDIKSLYEEYPELTEALNVLQDVTQNPDWKSFIEKNHTPEFIMERRQKLSDLNDAAVKKLTFIFHASCSDTPEAQEERLKAAQKIYKKKKGTVVKLEVAEPANSNEPDNEPKNP